MPRYRGNRPTPQGQTPNRMPVKLPYYQTPPSPSPFVPGEEVPGLAIRRSSGANQVPFRAPMPPAMGMPGPAQMTRAGEAPLPPLRSAPGPAQPGPGGDANAMPPMMTGRMTPMPPASAFGQANADAAQAAAAERKAVGLPGGIKPAPGPAQAGGESNYPAQLRKGTRMP